ncbi:MFS transporter [Legionella sp. km772]|uniref:MFS transporter n=1 Tax=Legionella sp. km772 TaxID=2498111 RepID=UPI000F8EDC87|nr:MFS transporter [Legionella sp. km772]RUR13456.1 MFS transporter [Legionella sp. km772]
MKYSWSKTVFPIAALFSFRMLGLFLLIPVFTLYAADFKGATPALIGIALGAYGLSQGFLQMPFGLLSDKWGRKPIITLGLILFIIGSFLGAFTDSIYGIILARTLQGTGAVGSVLIALLADLTPDESRTKAMAVIGMTIGLSFSLAMVISPALSKSYGLAGIFYLTAFLAILGLLLLHIVIPNPDQERFHGDSETNPALLRSVLSNTHLLHLNFGIFCQHFILTSTFFVLPLILNYHIEQKDLSQPWSFYLVLMIVAFIAMIPFIIYGEKKHKTKLVFLSSVLCTALAQGILIFAGKHWYSLCALMLLYFIGFNILEALLPSQISKQANPNSKGTAMGVYSTAQFLGIFAGGTSAGFLYAWQQDKSIFIANTLLSLLWLFSSLPMKMKSTTTLILSWPNQERASEDLVSKLLNLAGVKEVVFAEEESVIYIKINKELYHVGSAESLIKEYAIN